VSTHIALLRGINVGGRKKVAMAALRDVLEGMGFAAVRSLLQSGNLVFRSALPPDEVLERRLEAAARKSLGLDTEFFVRGVEQWRAIIAANPFPAEAERDPAHLLLLVLKRAPDAGRVEGLRAAIIGPEVVRAHGREAYVVYPDGIGCSKLTNGLIEEKLGTRVTARNWNTVLKLGAVAGD
jgi:uncharacterized protein (DUF1697 family)